MLRNILPWRNRHTLADPLPCADPACSPVLPSDTDASTALIVAKPSANLPQIPVSITVGTG